MEHKELFARTIRPDITHNVSSADGLLYDLISVDGNPTYLIISDAYCPAEAMYDLQSREAVAFRTKTGTLYRMSEEDADFIESSVLCDSYRMGHATVDHLATYTPDNPSNERFLAKFGQRLKPWNLPNNED